MPKIDTELQKYIETNILPIYKNNEKGHGIEHINYVIRRCLEFSKQFPNINLNILYTAAAFHDIGHHIDKDNHEILSAKIFIENNDIKNFFFLEERLIIKDAIEDHRASLEYEPRTIYGKILSSADRTTTIDDFIKRTYSYTLKHFPDYTMDQIIDRAYSHLQEKYSNHGYAKTYVKDIEFENFKKDIDILLENKNKFKTRYLKLIK